MQDPYKLLNVDRAASQEDIKRAYRKLAKELHPDINPGNQTVEQKFKEISQAYSILGDAEKRKRFDQGQIDASGQETPWKGGFYRSHAGSGRGGDKYSNFDFGEDVSADDIFADLFGSRTRRVRRPGANVSYTVPISFLEAAKGAKKRIKLADGKTLDVRIPPGTEDRQALRLKGQGMPGVGGGPAGDALVEVHIESHPFFDRKGTNVHVELPVTLQEALLGATVTVPTVHGSVSMKIPPGSNSGSTLRLKGKGIQARDSDEIGDQYVKLRVMLPERPDQELRDFVESWSRSHDYDPRRKAGMT
ncbi:MAG: DnaJ domain-containing protein [Kiloniellaceae bacterium]|jgi:DnaJ-class molecular chaperone|nr:DnaJ domain-containing protein [Kiloniellaceae bacterium]